LKDFGVGKMALKLTGYLDVDHVYAVLARLCAVVNTVLNPDLTKLLCF
jgi:hypothetical protein